MKPAFRNRTQLTTSNSLCRWLVTRTLRFHIVTTRVARARAEAHTVRDKPARVSYQALFDQDPRNTIKELLWQGLTHRCPPCNFPGQGWIVYIGHAVSILRGP